MSNPSQVDVTPKDVKKKFLILLREFLLESCIPRRGLCLFYKEFILIWRLPVEKFPESNKKLE